MKKATGEANLDIIKTLKQKIDPKNIFSVANLI